MRSTGSLASQTAASNPKRQSIPKQVGNGKKEDFHKCAYMGNNRQRNGNKTKLSESTCSTKSIKNEHNKYGS